MELTGSPQIARLLEVLEGHWKCRVTHEPNLQMPNGGDSTGWEECHVGPSGASILFNTQANGASGTFEGAGFITWNTANSCYDLYSLTSLSPTPSFFAGRWDGGSVVFDGHEHVGTERVTSRHSITEISASAFLYTIDMGSTPEKLKRTATIQYTRA